MSTAVEWSVLVDEDMLACAERDMRRALTLQNARISTRYDVLSRLRTNRNEERLRRFALVLCVVGVALALLLVIGSYLQRGQVRPLHLLLLGVLTTFTLVFRFAVRLRAAFIKRVDRLVAKRASQLRKAWPSGVKRDYRIEQGTLQSHVGERRTFSRPLSQARYGLVGECCIVLFAQRHRQTPVAALLVPAAPRAEVTAALAAADIELQELDASLMPRSTVARAW